MGDGSRSVFDSYLCLRQTDRAGWRVIRTNNLAHLEATMWKLALLLSLGCTICCETAYAGHHFSHQYNPPGFQSSSGSQGYSYPSGSQGNSSPYGSQSYAAPSGSQPRQGGYGSTPQAASGYGLACRTPHLVCIVPQAGNCY